MRKAVNEVAERRKAEERRAAAAKPIQYDIDAVIASPDFMTALDGILPESNDARYPKLTEVERHLQSLAEFDRRCGSGFSALLMNEYFELLAGTREAAHHLAPTLLRSALDRLESILLRFGFPEAVSQRHDVVLSDEQSSALEEEINSLDNEFFTYDQPSLWSSSDFRDATRDYAILHIEALRARKA
jgi:hypothetical protein